MRVFLDSIHHRRRRHRRYDQRFYRMYDSFRLAYFFRGSGDSFC